MTEEEKYELYEASAKKSLTEAQKKQLKDLKKENPKLDQEINLHQEIEEAIGPTSPLNQFRKSVKEVMSENAGPRSIFRGRTGQILAMAASVSILLIAGWWFFLNPVPSSEDLFDEYFIAPSSLGISRTTNSPSNQDKNLLQHQLDSLYQLKAYQEALTFLESKQNQPPINQSSSFHFHLGVLYLINEQPQAAIEALNKVKLGYQNDKNWYLALAYLKENKLDQAKPILKNIAQAEGPFRKEAGKILKQIK